MVHVSKSTDSVIEWMMHFEQHHPFEVDNARVHSRWASLDAGLVSKTIVARLVDAAPTQNIAVLKRRFCHDAGVCYERDEQPRRVLDGTIVLCRNRLDIAEWKKVFCGKNATFLERYDGGPAFQKRILGKTVWIVSKSVFQKMAVYPSRLICSSFGMADGHARFTWVVGYAPNARNSIHLLVDKSAWLRPRLVANHIHQLFKIPDVFFKNFNIPKRPSQSEFVCCVCYEETVERRLQLECTHRICFSCLFGCVSTGHFLCPVCRSPMDRTFVTEDDDGSSINTVALKNYEMALYELLKSKTEAEKWIVFQKTSHSEIGCGLYNFLFKNDNTFYASASASHFPTVDMCITDAVVLSEEHELSSKLLDSFLCHGVSHHRTKPLVIHCLYYNLDFIEKINKMINEFFTR